MAEFLGLAHYNGECYLNSGNVNTPRNTLQHPAISIAQWEASSLLCKFGPISNASSGSATYSPVY